MVAAFAAAVLAALPAPPQAHLGTAVTATFTNHGKTGVVCVVGGRCKSVRR
jgi:hypothetical protein